ncbi:Pimeloyl-ACP methyl ester carboxylesterase [Reichenbachiella faecimaris]|uniref:Pimeloyl-ACP methyl ester carboxylesterase n=1 Tax=Reichenbachiella faecimaris TaxID=692418 RepID=A0A1W2GNN0_REIFA|nr:alpha/beta hydrolase [Reichenbachiella faecimaris]SMD38052.1 Pimeloyl-ACP methyl ester carboxylesterase [Reichenbachiella faecimaris]
MKQLSSLLVIGILMTSCQSNKEALREITNEALITNQSKINYSTCGEGEIALLFVHGWNIDKSYWDVQQSKFCKDYQVVTMDLPGFGKSINTRGVYSIDAYANDVKELINHLDLKKVVLIGHSMGGRIVLEAAQNNGEIVALVGVDNYKEVRQRLTEKLQAEAHGFVEWLQTDFAINAVSYADQYLIHPKTDSIVRNRIVNDYQTADPKASVPAILTYFNYPYTEQERLSNLDVPLYIISSDMSPVDTIGLRNTALTYKVFEMSKTGHFPMVEQPELFNQYLTEALLEIKSIKE